MSFSWTSNAVTRAALIPLQDSREQSELLHPHKKTLARFFKLPMEKLRMAARYTSWSSLVASWRKSKEAINSRTKERFERTVASFFGYFGSLHWRPRKLLLQKALSS
jgi:hypothetical protein